MCNENTDILEYEEALAETQCDLDNLWEYVRHFADCLGTYRDPNRMLERLEELRQVEAENETLKGKLLTQIIKNKEMGNGEKKESRSDSRGADNPQGSPV